MRRKRVVASLMVLSLVACSGAAPGSGSAAVAAPTPTPAASTPTPSPTSTPVAAFTPAAAAIPTTGGSLKLGKCVNLSNMLEAPTEGSWGRAFLDSDIANIKSKGFTGIRLPVRFSAHALAVAPYTIDAAFMARVKHIVDLAVAADMAIIIDMHHYEELFTDPAGHAARFAEMWRQIGVAFKDYPPTVYFELINEPNNRLDASNNLAIQGPALAAVRATNPTRQVVIDGPSWANIDHMLTMAFPADPNIVPTFHYYDPQNFGFDTAPWMTPSSRDDFGTAGDIADLNAVLGKIRGFISSTGRVPFVGEYGAHEIRPNAARATYYGMVSAAFASAGVQSCAWGYTNTMHLWRDGSGWTPGVADAIVTTRTLP
ncbi:glycoside hydrolase family 5 protein [Sphingomonas sp. AOB5]|uniref:glycoside hydrolase family 5 protein n=1 Tax=Sphingomonas sp. AOB5 TaxID=3034017 RepID=UPI0023F7968B|nr:glycoside hydrolase family 5 protein [Sphingomonas sp. AOB5]MDF7776623.1 glycoside hydrolase family 5 protein [Sphingomonas sp. AOB5]